MTSDKAGRGVKWFFWAVFVFLVIYFHKQLWTALKVVWQLFIEPHLSK